MSRLFRYPGRILAGLISAAAIGAIAAPAMAMAAGSPALFNRETYTGQSEVGTAQQAARYDVLVLQSTSGWRVAALHAANPNLKVLMYMAVLHSVVSDQTGLTSCTPYSTDNSTNPGWFLTDQNGHRIPDRSYSGSYLMDMGDPGYQRACVSHAVALANQHGFDGVFLDGINASNLWLLPSGVTIPQYPTDSAWQGMTYSLLSYLGPQMRAQGLISVGNIGGSTYTAGLWQKWTTPLDGSEEESWADGGLGLAQQLPWWSRKLANVAWSEANGKYVLLHSHNTTETGNTYGLASMLLVAGGRSSYSTSNFNNTTSELWFPEYTTAQQLGAPTSGYVQLPNGVYERPFANGLVLVNPTTSSVGSFSLGGTYSGSGLSSVSSVSMGPTSGLILTSG